MRAIWAAIVSVLSIVIIGIGIVALGIIVLNVFKIPVAITIGDVTYGYVPASVINEIGTGGGNTAAMDINTPVISATPIVSSPGSAPGNPEPEGGWVQSFCEYRAGWVSTAPSGKLVESGYKLDGPALLIPVVGNVASWSQTRLIFEGESVTVAAKAVTQEYAFLTNCDLHAEVLNSPARAYFQPGG